MSNAPLSTEAVAVEKFDLLYDRSMHNYVMVPVEEGEWVKAERYDALQAELSMAHDQIRSLQSKVAPRAEPIRTHVREG